MRKNTHLIDQAWHEHEQPDPYNIEATMLSSNPRLETYNLGGSWTDRDLAFHEDSLNFSADELPENSRLLVIGSGVSRRFERELHKSRPDIAVFSADPMLRYGIQERVREAIRGVTIPSQMFDFYGKTTLNDLPTEMLEAKSYYLPGAVAGAIALKGTVAEHLPFKDKSFTTILASHSIPRYLSDTEVPFMLDETIRLLKPGGSARLFPFFSQHLDYLKDEDFQNKTANIAIDEAHPKDTACSGTDIKMYRVCIKAQGELSSSSNGESLQPNRSASLRLNFLRRLFSRTVQRP